MTIQKILLSACVVGLMASHCCASDVEKDAAARELAVRQYLEVKFDNSEETPEGPRVYGPSYNPKAPLEPVVIEELQPFLPDTFFYQTAFRNNGGIAFTPTIIAARKTAEAYDIRACLAPVITSCMVPDGKFFSTFRVHDVKTEAQRKQLTRGIGRLVAKLSSTWEARELALTEDSASIEIWGFDEKFLNIIVKFNNKNRADEITITKPKPD